MSRTAPQLIDGFLSFVERAKVITSPARPSVVAEFLHFVEDAQHLEARHPPPPRLNEFQAFINAASPLVISDIKGLLPTISERAALASRWLVTHDLLAVAGFSFVENSYTALMAWALHPPNMQPDSVLRLQTAWLQAIGIKTSICGIKPCYPRTQMRTIDGIPDLVLQFEGGAAIVEAKTGSTEHACPSGSFQTIAYVDAVRRELGLSRQIPIEVVFITPDGRQAENPAAKNTTFLQFAFALMRALEGETLSDDTRAAYAMLFSHFLVHANLLQTDVLGVIRQIVEWSKQPDWTEDYRIATRLREFHEAIELLMGERTP